MATATAPFVTWNDSWVIGVQEIDAQHKNLVSILNQLHQAMSLGHGKDVLGGILNSLIGYTKAHFAAEEALLAEYKFPETPTHRAEHDSFTQSIAKFREDYRAGKPGVPVSLMLFLQAWLKEHILINDKAYSSFLNARGVR